MKFCFVFCVKNMTFVIRTDEKKTAVCLHFSAVRRTFARKKSGYEKK